MTPDEIERLALDRGGTITPVNLGALPEFVPFDERHEWGPWEESPLPGDGVICRCKHCGVASHSCPGNARCYTRGQARQRLDEKAFQADVVKLAKRRGWACYHTLISKGSAAGFPDLVLVRLPPFEGRLVFLELKSERGKLTPEQEEWIGWLKRAGAEVHVFRPSDWKNIEEVLR